MNDWRKPCEHGLFNPHNGIGEGAHYQWLDAPCFGGSPVTAADLEGARRWFCIVEESITTRMNIRCAQHIQECGWRLLISIPDPPPVEL